MPLYRPGDRVVVRPDLRTNVQYYMADRSTSVSASSEMVRNFAGNVITITDINSYGRYIAAEAKGWVWPDEMFAGIEEPPEFETPGGDILSMLGLT